MDDPVTITRVTVDVTATLRECFGETITVVKDLQEHQRVCTTCKGLGAVKKEQVFGMRDEPVGPAGYFPYVQESIGPCPNCYVGIQWLCEHCGEPLQRGYTSGTAWCNCSAADKARRKEATDKEQARIAKAKRVPLSEYQGEMLYDDAHETFESTDFAGDLDPEHLYYACDPSSDWIEPAARLVVDDLNNRAADEYEDFEDFHIGPEAVAKLQELCEAWFREHVTLPVLYYPDYNTIVEVPWPERDDEEELEAK